ncbi:hypothetical protein Gotur_022767, partial [Gossypium turneri]
MDTCEMQTFYTQLTRLGGLNWIPHYQYFGREMETGDVHVPSSCYECTIILEDIILQLGLLVYGDVVMGPVVSADCSATCKKLLGKVPNKFRGSRNEIR